MNGEHLEEEETHDDKICGGENADAKESWVRDDDEVAMKARDVCRRRDHIMLYWWGIDEQSCIISTFFLTTH